MSTRKKWIAIAIPVALCVGGCQSLQREMRDTQALKVVPAEQVRHGIARLEALYAVGRYHQGQIRYDKAVDAYQQLLAEYPEHAEAHNALGIIFSIQGRHDAAIGELETAVAHAPDSASIRNNLGYAYLLRGRVEEALATFKIAARLDPANPRVRDNLEIAEARAGKTQIETAVSDAGAPGQAGRVGRKDVSSPEQPQWLAVAENVFVLQLPTLAQGKPISPQQGATWQVSEAMPDRQAEPSAPGNGMRLEVSNGNGVSGLAKKMSGHLRDSGYAKIRVTNALPYRLPATEIQYSPGFEGQARDLQATLRTGIPLVPSKQLRADIQVRLLLGKDVLSVNEAVAHAPSLPATTKLAANNP